MNQVQVDQKTYQMPPQRATADGYTIVMGHMGTHAASVTFYPNVSYNPDIDFAPIGLVIEQPSLIVARKDLPPNNLKEFVTYAKANSDKLNMAHAGVGSNAFKLRCNAQRGFGSEAHACAFQRDRTCCKRNGSK